MSCLVFYINSHRKTGTVTLCLIYIFILLFIVISLGRWHLWSVVFENLWIQHHQYLQNYPGLFKLPVQGQLGPERWCVLRLVKVWWDVRTINIIISLHITFLSISLFHSFISWQDVWVSISTLCKAIHVQRNDTCPTVIPRNCACVKQVMIVWKLIFGYNVQRQQIHLTVERFSTNPNPGYRLSPSVRLVENRSTVRYICCLSNGKHPVARINYSRGAFNHERANGRNFVK